MTLSEDFSSVIKYSYCVLSECAFDNVEIRPEKPRCGIFVVVFLQVNKSEKPSFHIAFELLFLHGVLQLFVKPDVASDFLQVNDFSFQPVTNNLIILKQFLVQRIQITTTSLQIIIVFHIACDLH